MLGSLSSELKILYKNKAQQLAHHLGTAYHPIDPRYYSENDEEVYNVASTITTVNEFKYISKLYNKVYAIGRTLSSDLLKLLDQEYYVKLLIK